MITEKWLCIFKEIVNSYRDGNYKIKEIIGNDGWDIDSIQVFGVNNRELFTLDYLKSTGYTFHDLCSSLRCFAYSIDSEDADQGITLDDFLLFNKPLQQISIDETNRTEKFNNGVMVYNGYRCQITIRREAERDIITIQPMNYSYDIGNGKGVSVIKAFKK